MPELTVAQGGILAIMGAKKIDRKKNNPQNTAVRPVREPASTPAPLSMNEVTGESPKMEPNIVESASTENACLLAGKSPVSSSTKPIAETSARSVPYTTESDQQAQKPRKRTKLYSHWYPENQHIGT